MNVLLAVDASDASTKAEQFVAQVLGSHADASIALLHVVESLPDHLIAGRSNEGRLREFVDEFEGTAKETGEALLEETKQRLVASGIDAGRVASKLVTADVMPGGGKVIAARAIIDELKGGRYDVVCLGRRGTSPAQGSFVGSVAEKVLREAAGTTVWVVD